MALQTEKDKIAHLLRRFGLGASEAEVTYYGAGGLSGAIDKLINYEQQPDPYPLDPKVFAVKGKILNPRGAQLHFYGRLLSTTRPLEEKMTVFWHNHFATSAEKVDSGEAMHNHIQTLRTHALDRFENILNAISKDPAMLYWLDNQENVRGKANENFAREVMELFTLGIGHYTEQDVQNSARAFTGWTYAARRGKRLVPVQGIPKVGAEFAFVADRHDAGDKNFLQNRGNFNGDDILGILVGNLQTSKFIVHKMWEWFAYPNPSQSLIDGLAEKWRTNGLDTKLLVRWIMESPEFYSEKAERAVLKNPIDFTIPVMRGLGMGANFVQNIQEAGEDQAKVRRAAFPANLAMLSTKAQGMELLYPPDVSGWRPGTAWISTATMVERIKVADSLFKGINFDAKGKGTARVTAGAFPAAMLFSDQTPQGAVRSLTSLFDAHLPESKMAFLIDAAKKAAPDGIDAQNANYVADSVSRLIFGSPEFQFA